MIIKFPWTGNLCRKSGESTLSFFRSCFSKRQASKCYNQKIILYIYRRKIPTIKIVENRFYNSNNRAVINEFGDVRQVTNFYPFGGVFCTTVYNRGDDLQPYKYNGKELDRTHGLDWYDYGARNYDAIVPMFTSIDPLCEKYYYLWRYIKNTKWENIKKLKKYVKWYNEQNISYVWTDSFLSVRLLPGFLCDAGHRVC